MSRKKALFSVYRKDNIDKFAIFLEKKGYDIISTGGTYKYLKSKGINVKEITEITNFPEILDGRVKTLNPKIHGGILAIRDKESHLKEIEKHNIDLIDFIVVNLYPFEETIANKDSKESDIIEQIDIGGVALIRAAGKNFKYSTVIVDNSDFDRVMDEIEKNGKLSDDTRLLLAAKAFSHTAYYDSLIANYFNKRINNNYPLEYAIPMKKISELRYGENPHQKAGLYSNGPFNGVGIVNADILWGKELSYNNILDADSALDIVREFKDEALDFCVIIKHTNPCGAALGNSQVEAYNKALSCDPVSAFGGIIGFNKKLEIETARLINERFYEIVIAPDYSEEALTCLKSKKNLRIIRLKGEVWEKQGVSLRKVEGGILAQDFDVMNKEYLKVVSNRKPTDEEMKDLEFAWLICKHVKSNAIVYVKNRQTIGIGAGQMSRIDSANIAAIKAKSFGFDTEGAVMASDAFFPFRDSVDKAKEYNIIAIIQPGGSIKDNEVIDAANEHNMTLIFTGTRHFKH